MYIYCSKITTGTDSRVRLLTLAEVLDRWRGAWLKDRRILISSSSSLISQKPWSRESRSALVCPCSSYLQLTQIWKNSAQVSFVQGNFLENDLIESNLPCGFPTYVIRHVLHDWADETVVSILKLVHQAMPQQARLILVEMLLTVTSSRLVRTTSVQLLALNNGVVRTLAQIRSLLAMAGFTVRKVVEMRSMDSIIEVVKADLE